MARPPRLEHAGALWHVSARGLARGEVFRDDADRSSFLSVLSRTVSIYGWRLHAYALAARSYELLVETPEPTLSRGMRDLNGVTSQRFNRRHGRSGPLFEGRFRAILVERETHLVGLARHVVRAPVREGLVRTPTAWPWSSCRATAGLVAPPDWLDTEPTLGALGRKRAEARRRWAALVEGADGAADDPWSGLRRQVFLGSEAFARRSGSRAGRGPEKEASRSPHVIPGRRADAVASAFEAARNVTHREMVATPRKRLEDRALLAWALRARARATLATIAESLGVGISQASVLVRRGESLAACDPALEALVEDL